MPATINSGLVDDQDVLASERVIDMSEVVGRLEAETTQFTTMLMKVANKTCHSTKVEWLEDQLFPTYTTLSASISAGSATMPVATGTGPYFRLYDIARFASTGEAVAVSAAPSTDTVGIVRSVGSVAAASVASGVGVMIIGNAAAQGAAVASGSVVERVAQYNYTQIFRHSYSFTNTMVESEVYLEDSSELDWERRKKAIEHKRAIELSLFLGAREFYTAGTGIAATNEPTGVMGGLYEYISTNTHDAGGTFTSTELETFSQQDLQYADIGSFVYFAGPTTARAISAFASAGGTSSTFRVTQATDAKRWGVKVDMYYNGTYGGGGIPIFVHRDWQEYTTAATDLAGLQGSLYGVDMSSVRMRTMRNRSTRLLRARQAPGDDKTTEEYLTECTLEVRVEKKHSRVYQITG